MEKYGNTGKTLTVFTIFDRWADKTKEATEEKRGEAPPTILRYSAQMKTDFQETISNYRSQWKDRDFFRPKITNAYTSFFKAKENKMKLGIPPGSRYIVVGGDGCDCSAVKVDLKGEVQVTDPKPCNSCHPEADTGVFYCLKTFLAEHPEANGTQIIIDCPETDCLTICLQSVSWILAEFYFNRGLQRLYTGTCIILQKTINGFLCLLIVFLKSKTYQLILKDVIKLNRNLR